MAPPPGCPNQTLQVRSVSLSPTASPRLWGIRNKDRLIVDNGISVPVKVRPCQCRSDGIALEVATDHQSSQPGSQVGPRHPTGNPIEPSCIRLSRGGTQVRIVVRLG